ncbi:MAG: hypothetical protein ACR2P3_08500 [Geminicoccaceae bacterium]
MAQNTYVDGIGSIAVVAGNVRVTLFSYLAEPEEDGQQAVHEPSVRLVMSRTTFLKTYQRFQRMAQEMDAKGMFDRAEPEETTDKPNEAIN